MQRTGISSTPACASCKHQRKKCTEKCVLAPFFPIEKTREFQAVHKVFGVSNVTKLVTNLKEEDRKKAVESLVWEALCRQKDPILGPYGEFRKVSEELKLYKSQYLQGSTMYKPGQSFTGWNNNNGNNAKVTSTGGINNTNLNSNTNSNTNNSNSNNSRNNSSINGNCIADFNAYSYSPHHVQETNQKLRGERDTGVSLILPQAHITNGFNSPYFLPGTYNTGQYNPMDPKSMANALWESTS